MNSTSSHATPVAFVLLALALPAQRERDRQATTAPGSQRAAQEPARLSLIEKHERYEQYSWISKQHKEDWDGFLLKPKGQGPFPAVIGNHAGMVSADGFVRNVGRAIVRRGFVIIGCDLGHKGRFRNWKGPGASDKNVQRVLTALAILKTLPYVDQDRIAMYGHSMGGFCTLGVLARDAAKDIRVAAISGAGIHAPQRRGGSRNLGRAAPDAKQARRIRTPLIMIHADNDRTVPLSRAQALKKILDKNKVPNELVLLKGVGHRGSAAGRPKNLAAILEFFEKHWGQKTATGKDKVKVATTKGLSQPPSDQANTKPITWPFVPEAVSPLEVITVKARDGEEASAVLRKPPGNGPFPAVIFLHGGLRKMPLRVLERGATNRHTLSRFLAAGYVIVNATFRERQQDPLTTKALWDCTAIAEHLRKLPYVDAKSVTAIGCSGGGSLALELAGEIQLAAIVAEEPATCLFTGLHSKDAGRHPWLYDDPKGSYKPQEAYTRAKIKKIRCPVLVVHGDKHPINIFNNAAFLPEMKAVGKPPKIILYPGGQHCFFLGGTGGRPDLTLKAFQDTLAFFAKQIRVQPKPLDDPRIEQRSIAASAGRPGGGPRRRGGAGGASILERIKAHDKNKDGKITRQEASEQFRRRMFDRIDSNGDGVIDEAELKKLAERFRAGRRRL